jgi:cytidine deaminase
MKTVPFATLDETDRSYLTMAANRIPRALNKVSNPKTSVVAVTAQGGAHFGNNIFLSNCTLSCGEANALAACVAAGDTDVTALYFAMGRGDSKAPSLITPCGNCRQQLHDFARLSGHEIKVFSTTNQLDEVIVTDSTELLPEGFKSASLGKMAA